MVSRRRTVPSMFGPCGRFSGVSWANRWVSFMPCLISAYFAIPIEGAGGVKTKRPQRCDARKLNGGATLVHRRQHLADLAQWQVWRQPSPSPRAPRSRAAQTDVQARRKMRQKAQGATSEPIAKAMGARGDHSRNTGDDKQHRHPDNSREERVSPMTHEKVTLLLAQRRDCWNGM
jgi:hypothetical protein